MRFCLAIVAHDIDNTLQIRGHGMFRNISGTGFPRGGHTLLADHSLFANGTAVIKARKFAEAMRVDGVSAGQILWRLARTEHIFSADWAVVLVLVLEALVGIEYANRNAHAAFVAVTEGFDTTDTAKSTLITVEWLFRL